MFYAVSIMMLGYTRTNGVQAYDTQSKGFEEITPAAARQLISKNLLKGLKWKNNEESGGEFICDEEGWNQRNIPVKTACGKFRPLLHDVPGAQINSMYTVVRVLDTDYKGRLFEIVSNKCARIKVTEQNLRELSGITNVAGVWITEDEIKLADGVQYEDRRASAIKEQESQEEAKAEEPVTEEQAESEAKADQLHENESQPVAEESLPQEEEKPAQTLGDIFGENMPVENTEADSFMKVPEEAEASKESDASSMDPVFGDEAITKKNSGKRKRK